MKRAPYFSKQNLNFGLDETLTYSTHVPNLLRQNIRHKDTKGDTTEEHRQNQTQK
jgi:hypothetical protein